MELGGDSELPEDIHFRSTSPLQGPFVDPANFIKAQTDSSWTRFTFVRNPYSRIVSCFLNKFQDRSRENDPKAYRRMLNGLGLDIRRQPDFLEFLNAVKEQPFGQMDIHWLPQTLVLKGFVAPAIIGRFESFKTDFSHILQQISGENCPTIEDARKYYAHSYSTDAVSMVGRIIGRKERELVTEIYEKDFEVLGYSPDPDKISHTEFTERPHEHNLLFLTR